MEWVVAWAMVWAKEWVAVWAKEWVAASAVLLRSSFGTDTRQELVASLVLGPLTMCSWSERRSSDTVALDTPAQ